MAESSVPIVKLSKSRNPFIKKSSLSSIHRYRKNRNRNLRRRRNRVKYVEQLRELRINRKTDELCASVQFFDITDMEHPSEQYVLQPPKEVTEWQYNHQLAYWKSRAISLEYENRMLHQRIKEIYTRQIQDYNKSIQNQQLEESSYHEDNSDQNHIVDDQVEDSVSQSEEENHVKLEELYGNMAPKINGMETAMQISYKLQVDKCNPPHWPNLPLNL